MNSSTLGIQFFVTSLAGGLAVRGLTRRLSSYTLPKVWQAKPALGAFAAINAPTAGPRKELALPVGKHPFQLYSLGTPNGVKVTILLEELCDKYSKFEYDAWLLKINGDQFGDEFVSINPNSKIPAAVDHTDGEKPVRLFESASIMLYLCEKYDTQKHFLPDDRRTEILNWLFWLQGSAPFVGGGFGHFYNYAPYKIEYAIDRYSMETKRLLDVLDRRLGGSEDGPFSGGAYLVGNSCTLADMAVWPWFGALALGKLYPASDEFLNVKQYTHVCKWAELMNERDAVVRGRKVNRPFGAESEQLLERHDRSDFELRTQDKIAK